MKFHHKRRRIVDAACDREIFFCFQLCANIPPCSHFSGKVGLRLRFGSWVSRRWLLLDSISFFYTHFLQNIFLGPLDFVNARIKSICRTKFAVDGLSECFNCFYSIHAPTVPHQFYLPIIDKIVIRPIRAIHSAQQLIFVRRQLGTSAEKCNENINNNNELVTIGLVVSARHPFDLKNSYNSQCTH